MEAIQGEGCVMPLTKEVVAKCLDKGVVVLSVKNKVRLLPALNIPDEQLAKAIAILKEVLASAVVS